jgi:hypothetical protein
VQLRNCGSISGRGKIFAFCQLILVPTHPPIQWVAVACESDHSPPSSAKVKHERSYTSTLPFVFMTWIDSLDIRLIQCWRKIHESQVVIYQVNNLSPESFVVATDKLHDTPHTNLMCILRLRFFIAQMFSD